MPYLDAKYWYLLPPTTRSVPTIGGQILMRYNDVWDVATIVEFTADGFKVIGVDFATCEKTYRVIPFVDKRIALFFDF